MATNRTFANMINEKPVSKKPMEEDDMDPVPKGGLKLPKGKTSTYSGMAKKEKK